MSELSAFRHKTPIQIRFSDLDSLNHVNNANYLTYIESARISYFHQVMKLGMDDRKGVILAKATIDYKLPVMLEDQVTVYTRCSHLGNKSLTLEYALVKEELGVQTLMAQASTVIVAYDYETRSSMALLPHWIESIKTYENMD